MNNPNSPFYVLDHDLMKKELNDAFGNLGLADDLIGGGLLPSSDDFVNPGYEIPDMEVDPEEPQVEATKVSIDLKKPVPLEREGSVNTNPETPEATPEPSDEPSESHEPAHQVSEEDQALSVDQEDEPSVDSQTSSQCDGRFKNKCDVL